MCTGGQQKTDTVRDEQGSKSEALRASGRNPFLALWGGLNDNDSLAHIFECLFFRRVGRSDLAGGGVPQGWVVGGEL